MIWLKTRIVIWLWKVSIMEILHCVNIDLHWRVTNYICHVILVIVIPLEENINRKCRDDRWHISCKSYRRRSSNCRIKYVIDDKFKSLQIIVDSVRIRKKLRIQVWKKVKLNEKNKLPCSRNSTKIKSKNHRNRSNIDTTYIHDHSVS
jgi:hypothetical protein